MQLSPTTFKLFLKNSHTSDAIQTSLYHEQSLMLSLKVRTFNEQDKKAPFKNKNEVSTIWLFHQPMTKSCQSCNHTFDRLPEVTMKSLTF